MLLYSLALAQEPYNFTYASWTECFRVLYSLVSDLKTCVFVCSALFHLLHLKGSD